MNEQGLDLTDAQKDAIRAELAKMYNARLISVYDGAVLLMNSVWNFTGDTVWRVARQTLELVEAELERRGIKPPSGA